MRVLVIGGTGLISLGIIKHLQARGAAITVLNRGKRAATPAGVEAITGDRGDPAVLQAAAAKRFDVVIDMVCFQQAQADAAIAAFAGRCTQYQFCSTVCAYGPATGRDGLVREDEPLRPTTGYGRGKAECEEAFLAAGARGDFAATIVRPSHTYGPGSSLIDQLEFDPPTWDRIERGLPVLCAGDGLGMWQSTHRDDCGAFFAYAALNRTTYGRAYNAVRPEVMPWSAYYAEVAAALGRQMRLLSLPIATIIAADPGRFGFLTEITRWHGAYDATRAMADVPEFRPRIGLREGAAQTLADAKRRGAWKASAGDALYDRLVAQAESLGAEVTLAHPATPAASAAAR